MCHVLRITVPQEEKCMELYIRGWTLGERNQKLE